MESNSPEARKEVFRALVEAQDQGKTVEQSRTKVAIKYDLSLKEVLEIEREGIRMKWPPLGS
jgi:hypothetical protein